MTAPKVTVLMSVLNGEEFLAEAIDSVLAQTFADFEFLIIDNASTDATPKIIAGYEDPRIVCLRNAETLTLTQALNKGLAAARGEYIARLDADDIADPARLGAQAAFLDAHPDVALVASGWIDFFGDDTARQVPGPVPPSDHAALLAALAERNVLAHSSLMFRRDAVREVGGYPERFAYAMEYALYFKLAERHRLACLPQALVWMRNHEGQISNRVTLRTDHLLEEFEIAATVAASTLDDGTKRLARRKQVKTAIQIARSHLKSRQLSAACCWLSRSFFISPSSFVGVVAHSLPRLING